MLTTITLLQMVKKMVVNKHKTIAVCIMQILGGSEYKYLHEIRNIYLAKTGVAVSRQAVYKSAKKLEKQGKLKLKSYGKLGLRITSIASTNESIDSMLRLNLTTKQPKKPIHTAHNISISIAYKGKQPTHGAIKIRPFGRYKTAIQAIFQETDKITIITFKNKLNIRVHKPKGTLTREQLIQAKTDAYIYARSFASKHNIELLGYLEQVISSHHVLENKHINDLLVPIFTKYEGEIYKRIGSKICKSSHKGKTEHEGNDKYKGYQVANGVEQVFLDMPKLLKDISEKDKRYMTSISLYDEQIRKHLAAIQDIRDYIKELRDLKR